MALIPNKGNTDVFSHVWTHTSINKPARPWTSFVRNKICSTFEESKFQIDGSHAHLGFHFRKLKDANLGLTHAVDWVLRLIFAYIISGFCLGISNFCFFEAQHSFIRCCRMANVHRVDVHLLRRTHSISDSVQRCTTGCETLEISLMPCASACSKLHELGSLNKNLSPLTWHLRLYKLASIMICTLQSARCTERCIRDSPARRVARSDSV